MKTLEAAPARRLEALIDVFRAADARMADLPVYNPALAVEGRGFGPYEDMLLGVLLTPWCMNLVLLPGEGGGWPSLAEGTETDHALPRGTVRFVTARHDGPGDYRMCSLFSPMFQFADMEAAQATADAALAEVLTAPEPASVPEPEPPRAVSRRDLFRRRAG